ncbi:CDP-diacylglycerol--serine O-phosphatidyltransferase [Candidatus Woesearchaeota archaeon]|nr:CDP-diacylglycerol--serine O-phosphatidyltransferase [Candidatus Woesearchaeota archaeon]
MGKFRNLDKFDLKKIMNLPDMITFLNLLSGLLAIYFIVQREFQMAAILLIVAVFMDFMDGKVASLLKQKTEFGKQIDSLADMSSFGIATAFFGFSYAAVDLFLGIALIFFITCGMIRLARYNIINLREGFIGMPITLNGLIIPLIFFFSLPTIFYPYLFILLGALMISPFTIRRVV